MPPAVDLAALRDFLDARGERLGEAAARHLGHALAAMLAEAHAALDGEGNPAPVIRGALAVRVDAEGEVLLLPEGGERTAPEILAGGRLTPRADVHALGAILLPLLGGSTGDAELLAAISTATEPDPSRRRITCVEIEAWLARGADLDAGRRALAAAVQSFLDAQVVPPPWSRPLAAPAQVGVALVTAAAVFAAGVAVAERWLGR